MSKQKQVKKAAAATMATGLPLWQHKHFFKGLIFLFAFLLFANSIPNDYNMDDELVTINHRLTSKGVSAIPEIFTSPYYQDAQGYSYEYRPVVLVSFAIEHQFFGDNAHVSHFFNIVLYALCCLVLYLVLLRLFKKHFHIIPLAITLLFIAHPAHTEVVCSIKNRDEILGLLFSFLTLHSALIAIQNSKKWLLILVPLFFTLALMSKITVISFVILIPLALILFTEAGLGSIMLTTILLQIPSYFLLNLSSGFEKIMAQLGITVIVLVFYMLVNPQKSIAGSKKFFNRIYVSLFQLKLGERQQDSTGNKEYWFRDVFKGIMPDRKMFSILPFLIAGLLASAYLLGITKGYSSLGLLPLVVLIILAWKGEEKISWWATVMIGFVLVINLFNLPNYDLIGHTVVSDNYNTLVMLYLFFQLFYGQRNFFIPTLLSILLLNYFSTTRFHNWDWISFVFVAPLSFFRVTRYVTALIIVIVITIMYPYAEWDDKTTLLQYVMGLVMLMVIHFKKGSRIFLGGVAFGAIFLFHFNNAPQDKKSSIPYTISSIVGIANRVNPKIISSNEDRPIQYVESCVNMEDPIAVCLGTSLEICFHYLQKVVLPYPLAFYYGFKFIQPQKITDTIPVISLVLHLLLLMVAFLLLNKDRVISFGLFIYLLSIIVFSNYLQFVPGMLADRFLLIPSLGWCIVLITSLQKIFKLQSNASKFPPIPAKARYTFAGILLLYSTITFSRNFDWENDLALFRHDIAYVDKSSQAHNLLAVHLMKESELQTNPAQKTELEKEALVHFKRAQEIYPEYFNVAFDIGRVYMTLNMPDSAINAFKYTLTIDTSFRDVQRNIGQLLFQQGKLEHAIPYFENVIKYRPEEYNSYDMLSYIYFKLNQTDKSIFISRQAANQLPSLPDPLINIGRVYQSTKQLDSARYYFQRANEISPGNSGIQQLLQQVSTP